MKIHVEEEVLGIKEWEATVVSNYNVATFIKEFIVEIPEDMDYKAGGYIQIKIPACTVKYSEMNIEAHPQDHPGEPDKFRKHCRITSYNVCYTKLLRIPHSLIKVQMLIEFIFLPLIF